MASFRRQMGLLVCAVVPEHFSIISNIAVIYFSKTSS